MPKVRFLQDFQGKETREVFYKQGQEVDLPDNMISQLVADKRVELVKDAPHYGAQAEPELRHDDELYKEMTAEPVSKPAGEVKIVTNNEEAAEFFNNLPGVDVEVTESKSEPEPPAEEEIMHTKQAPKRSKRSRK